MEKVVVRIFEAIEAKEPIVIYSDYDCDGIPAATIMSDLFTKIGYEKVSYYIKGGPLSGDNLATPIQQK